MDAYDTMLTLGNAATTNCTKLSKRNFRTRLKGKMDAYDTMLTLGNAATTNCTNLSKMELPHEIWDQIVKNAKNGIRESIDSIDNIKELDKLINMLNAKKEQLVESKRQKFHANDIVKDKHGKFYIVASKPVGYNLSVNRVYPITTFTSIGRYVKSEEGKVYKFHIEEVELVKTRKETEEESINYANTLRSGDIVHTVWGGRGTVFCVNKVSVLMTMNDGQTIRFPKTEVRVI